MEKDTGYHVILCFTEKADPKLVGAYTMHRFDDKEEFDAWDQRRSNKEVRKVEKQGISEELARQLCSGNRRAIIQRDAVKRAVKAAHQASARANRLKRKEECKM